MNSEIKTQLRKAPGRVESRPNTLNTEKRAPIAPKTERGSQRFAKLGPTREFKYGRQADPLDRQVGRSEISRMVKIAEAPKAKLAAPETKTTALAKTEPRSIAERVVHKVRPEDITKIVPERKGVRPAELPQPVIDLTPIRGSSRYHRRSEVAARLNGMTRTPDRGVKTAPELAQLNSGSRQTARAEIIANLVKNQKVGLKDAMAAPVPAATRREMVAGLFRTQSGGLAEITASKPASVAEQNIKTAAEAAKTPDRKPLTSDQSAKLAQLVTESGNKPIDIQKAREIVTGQKNDNTPSAKVESVADAVKVLEQAKSQTGETQTKPASETKPKLQPHLEAAIQIVQQPDKVAIPSEKRDQAIELLRELSQTPEYATNQKLQEQLKRIAKTEQEKAVEEAQVKKTAEQLLVAGVAKEQVVVQLQQAMNSKQILVSEQMIVEIVTEVEQKIQFESGNIDNGNIDVGDDDIDDKKEKFDENEERIRRLQELLVELDENVLEKRFETFFKALDKTWIQATEEGWTEVKFEHVIANLPAEEPGSEKSPIIRELERHDGSRVEATEEAKGAGSFDNLDIARQTLTNILLNHLPGRLTQQITTQALTAAQIAEILQGGSYPHRMGQGNDDIQYAQNNSQFYANAA